MFRMVNHKKRASAWILITSLVAAVVCLGDETGEESASEPAPEPASEPAPESAPATAPVDVSQKSADKVEFALPMQLSLTSSGGVSLGAYQAGYMYYLIETVKNNPELLDTKVLTGASAGTINSTMAAISLGQGLVDEPSDSLFYQLWTEIHHRDLLDIDEAPPLSVTSRKVLDRLADKLEAVWNEGLSEELDVVLGATATRVESRDVQVAEDFSVPRQEEKFVFRIRGRGKGKLPLVTNYVDQAHGIEQPLLPFVDPDDIHKKRTNFSILRQVMFASSAFPLAFPSQEIEFCMSSPEVSDSVGVDLFRDCPVPKFKEEFVDGSMFDRNPVGLAFRVAQSGLVWDGKGGLTWRDSPKVRRRELASSLYFLYLDATRASYPSYEGGTVTRRVEALFPAFGEYSQGFVRSSQAKELYFLMDEEPELRGKIDTTARTLPTASGQLANFFGFFERDFRIYDFYLGMYDAHHHLKRKVRKALSRKSGQTQRLAFPEADVRVTDGTSWNPFFCMRSVLDGVPSYTYACDDEALQDFRILFQVSLDRLYDHCSNLELDETLEHPQCIEGMRGIMPPRLQQMPEYDYEIAWVRTGRETEFQYTMRLLEQYHFHFEDLGLEREDAWLAMSRIREVLAGTLDGYAKKLPPGESLTLRLLGKPALNFFKYQPPQAIVYVAAGKGSELGLSLAGRYSPYRWLRFNLGFQFKGLYELMSPADNLFAVTPLIGAEFENPRWSSPLLQARLGLRVGYQFSTGDRFLAGDCTFSEFSGHSGKCSAPVAQAFLAFTLYERIRIQGGVEWFPYFLPPMSDANRSVWNGFIEIGWQWISPF